MRELATLVFALRDLDERRRGNGHKQTRIDAFCYGSMPQRNLRQPERCPRPNVAPGREPFQLSRRAVP